MKNQFLLTAILTALLICIGCTNSETTQKSNESGTHVHADGTVHSDDSHAGDDSHGAPGHSHDDPPHGGTVLDWGGGKYHLEFTVSHEKQEATVYVLGDDVKTAVAIDAASIELAIKDPQFQVTLQASPQEGDAEGKASRFVGNHENLGIVKEYEGTIFGTIGETPYSGDFKELPHDH